MELEGEKDPTSYKEFFVPEMRMRQSSLDTIGISDVIFFKPFVSYMKRQYKVSACGIIDLREIVL